MTSANVIEFRIMKSGRDVGYFRKNLLCKFPEYTDLLKYQPLKEHKIISYGYDCDDEYWENKPENLEKFLKKVIPNKFKNESP